MDLLGEPEAEADADGITLGVTIGDRDGFAVAVSDAVSEAEGEGVAVVVPLEVAESDGTALAVPEVEPDAAPDEDGVSVGEPEADTPDEDGVSVGEAEAEADADTVAEGEGDLVATPSPRKTHASDALLHTKSARQEGATGTSAAAAAHGAAFAAAALAFAAHEDRTNPEAHADATRAVADEFGAQTAGAPA